MGTFRSLLTSTQSQTTYLLLLIVFGAPAFIMARLLFPDLAGSTPSTNDPAFIWTFGPPLLAGFASLLTLVQLQRYFGQLSRITTIGRKMPSALLSDEASVRGGGSELRELIDVLSILYVDQQTLRKQNEQQLAEYQRMKTHYESLHQALLKRIEQLVGGGIDDIPFLGQNRTSLPHAIDGLRISMEDALHRARMQGEQIDRFSEQVVHTHESTATCHQQLVNLRTKSGALSSAMQDLMSRTQTVGQIAASVKLLASEIDHVALNATIEAARAGDVGRGFSIVAAEVRSLAEQSKGAAQKMRQVLEEIQQAGRTTLAFAMESEQSVTELADSTRQTASSLHTLSAEAAQAQEAANQLLGVVSGQNDAVTQLKDALTHVTEGSEKLERLSIQQKEIRRVIHLAQSQLSGPTEAVQSSQGALR